MKKYELVFNNEDGVFKISLVKDPAIETTLLHFNAENPQVLHFTQDEKQIVYAPAMIPNKLIFRNNINGENAQVFYTSETIDQLQKNYFKNGHNSNTNINHQQDITGVYPFESWIVQDPKNDKSNAMGFDVPAGTWMMGYKIDNQAIWDEVKSGNLDGLSIEARLGFKEVTDNKNYNKQRMNKKSIWQSIKDFYMASDEKKEFNAGDKKVYAIELKEGEIVTDEAGEPLANATLEIDSKIYKTDDLGTISTIEDQPANDTPTVEVSTEVEPAEQLAEDPQPALVEDLKAENEQLKKDLAKAQEDLAKLQAEKVKAETELTQMKAQTPAAQPIKNLPIETIKSYAEMSNYEKMQYNKSLK